MNNDNTKIIWIYVIILVLIVMIESICLISFNSRLNDLELKVHAVEELLID